MQDIITVKIETKHFRDSNGYTSITNCPLARALKDMFKYNVQVGGTDVDIDDPNGPVTYKFNNNLWNYGIVRKNTLKAKNGEEIEPIYLELRKV